MATTTYTITDSTFVAFGTPAPGNDEMAMLQLYDSSGTVVGQIHAMTSSTLPQDTITSSGVVNMYVSADALQFITGMLLSQPWRCLFFTPTGPSGGYPQEGKAQLQSGKDPGAQAESLA